MSTVNGAYTPSQYMYSTSPSCSAEQLRKLMFEEKVHHVYIIDFELVGKLLPVEIAVAKFKIETSGVHFQEDFHMFINPGKVPRSLMSNATFTIDHIHGITAAHYKNYGEANFSVVWSKLLKFLGVKTAEDARKVILLAKGPDAENSCIELMKRKSKEQDMTLLRNQVADVSVFLHAYNSSLSEEKIHRAIRLIKQYKKKKCNHHQKLNITYHCASEDVHAIGSWLHALVSSKFSMLEEATNIELSKLTEKMTLTLEEFEQRKRSIKPLSPVSSRLSSPATSSTPSSPSVSLSSSPASSDSISFSSSPTACSDQVKQDSKKHLQNQKKTKQMSIQQFLGDSKLPTSPYKKSKPAGGINKKNKKEPIVPFKPNLNNSMEFPSFSFK